MKGLLLAVIASFTLMILPAHAELYKIKEDAVVCETHESLYLMRYALFNLSDREFELIANKAFEDEMCFFAKSGLIVRIIDFGEDDIYLVKGVSQEGQAWIHKDLLYR